jgi:phosphohistidine phosphatase
MRRLILLRHATAAHPLGDDLARPLTAKGTREAAAAGRALATRGLNPDKVLVSPARRTQETWSAMQDFFPGAEVETVPALYDAPPETLLDAAMDETEADTVLVVAHNPGLHQLAYSLSIRAGRPAPRHFPPGAAAVFGFEGKSPRFPSVILPGEPE